MQGLSEAAAISEQSGWGQRMSKGATKPGTVIGFPCAVTDAVRDETVASIVDVLQEQLRFAREGKLRSVAVVSVSADGSSSCRVCVRQDGCDQPYGDREPHF